MKQIVKNKWDNCKMYLKIFLFSLQSDVPKIS